MEWQPRKEQPALISIDNTISVHPYEGNRSAWDSYAKGKPASSAFHTSGMIEAFSRTPRHEVLALEAKSSGGETLAQLVSVTVSAFSGIARFFSSRSVMYSEPIWEPTPLGHMALHRLLELHDEEMHKKSLFAEMRIVNEASGIDEALTTSGYERGDFLNYIVDTSRPTEELWCSIGKSTRGKIRRSIRRGVRISTYQSTAAVYRAYALISRSYRRSNVPLVDVNLFLNALEFMPSGSLQIRIATHEGRDVAAMIGIVHSDRFYSWYGGTSRPVGIDPFACIVWDEIQWCHQAGVAKYDFGGAGAPTVEYGPRIFKSRFHGELVNYGRYRKVYSRTKLAIAERGYQSLGLVFGKAPQRSH